MHTFLWDLEGQQDVPLARVNDVVGDLAALIDQVRQERDRHWASLIANDPIDRIIRAAATAPAPEDPNAGT
jgi:hypothetical protein